MCRVDWDGLADGIGIIEPGWGGGRPRIGSGKGPEVEDLRINGHAQRDQREAAAFQENVTDLRTSMKPCRDVENNSGGQRQK